MRVITNRKPSNCAFCHEPIAIGEECIQSEGINYGYKWHEDCIPERRFSRFGKRGMNSEYARENLASEHHNPQCDFKQDIGKP